MAKTYLMKFVNEDTGRLDRIGGLPTHVPEQFPIGPKGNELSFVAQFEVVKLQLILNGARLIQVYQDSENDPWPTAVVLDEKAQDNSLKLGRQHPLLPKVEIVWEPIEEPVESGDWDSVERLSLPEEGRLQSSKAGGFCYYESAIDPGDRFLIQVTELGLATGVFGGHTLVVLLNADNQVEARLG